MRDIVISPLPQMAPISDMRHRQNELLRLAEAGPIVLMSRNRPVAVLLAPDQWQAIVETLAKIQHHTETAKQLVATERRDDGSVR